MAMTVKPKKDSKGKVVGVVLDIDFSKAVPSSSGKTLVDFSTRGNVSLDLGDGVGYKAGINIYHYPN